MVKAQNDISVSIILDLTKQKPYIVQTCMVSKYTSVQDM